MRWKSHILLGLAIAFFVVAPAIFGSFTMTLMNYIGIYAFAALGLVLLTGVGGLTSFGQAAFVGIGAYATAWYTSVHGGSPWIGLLLALVLTGLVAPVLGAATLRLGGHFLLLSTIAWALPSISCSETSMRLDATAGYPEFQRSPLGRFRSRATLRCISSFGDCSVS